MLVANLEIWKSSTLLRHISSRKRSPLVKAVAGQFEATLLEVHHPPTGRDQANQYRNKVKDKVKDNRELKQTDNSRFPILPFRTKFTSGQRKCPTWHVPLRCLRLSPLPIRMQPQEQVTVMVTLTATVTATVTATAPLNHLEDALQSSKSMTIQ